MKHAAQPRSYCRGGGSSRYKASAHAYVHGQTRWSGLEARKQTLGVAAINRAPIGGREAGIFVQTLRGQLVASYWYVGAEQDLRDRHEVLQGVQGRDLARVRRLVIKLLEFVFDALRQLGEAVFRIVVDHA